MSPSDALFGADQAIQKAWSESREMRGDFRLSDRGEIPKDIRRVIFWHTSHPLYNRIASDPRLSVTFEDAHPGIAFEHQFIGEWYASVQKLTVSLAAGDLPDIALVRRSWLAHLLGSGLVAELEVILPESLLKDLRPTSRSAFTQDGHLYGWPADGFCSVLYYKKDKLSAPPRNWEELHAAALRLRDGSPRDGKFSAVGDYPFLEALYSAGGSVLGSAGSGLALPEAREALEYTLRFKWDGLSNDRVFGRPDAGFGAFTWGQVGMTVASSDQLPGLGEAKTAYAIAPVPGKGGPVSLLSDYAFVVFSKHAAARKEAIATVLDWLSGAEFQGRAALELGSAPTRESVRATLELEASASGVEAAYSIARVHPFSPLWNSAEMELWRYLGRAYRYQPKPN